jgi:hypothetical protein
MMSHETTPKIENLAQSEQELTPEEAEQAQGGSIASPKPTMEVRQLDPDPWD